MTRSYAIVSTAVATAAINVVVALVIGFTPPLRAGPTETLKLHNSTTLYQLSPIPAGADWDRS
jgi:hypothetical protein